MKTKKIKIAFYSGTGGTARVAKCFEAAFKEAGYEVCMQHLSKGAEIEKSEYGLLLLLYPVYACNAPEAVYKWLENIEAVHNVPAIVISVSGGGEVIPNTACRTSSIKRLEKKGFHVIYEKMLVMPSNWIVSTKEPLELMLLEILPGKVKAIVDDIENGIVRRTKPYVIDRFFSCIGKLEKFGARAFGKRIKLSGNCIGCGWCSNNCPAGNITLKSNKPEFGNNCHLCLNCIYGCPNKAIKPGIGKFVVIKEGYSLKDLENMLPFKKDVDVEKLAKGYLWSGIRKYLLERD